LYLRTAKTKVKQQHSMMNIPSGSSNYLVEVES